MATLKLKALVIDDSRIMRTMVKDSLTKTGIADFEFVEAENGSDGLTKFDASSIDIVFVDWNMPSMTGVEFVRQVRKLGNTQDIPLIMVTSEKTMAKVQEALDEAGADQFISKPFTPEDMQRKVAKVLEKVEKNQIRRSRDRRDQAVAKPATQSSGFFSKLFN